MIQEISLVIDFYQMWWLLKEPLLATCSAMLNQHSTKQGAVAPTRAIFNTWLQHLEPPPQLEQPCAKRGRYILHTSPA